MLSGFWKCRGESEEEFGHSNCESANKSEKSFLFALAISMLLTVETTTSDDSNELLNN